MLADSVEAAARSLDRPTPARIQGLVESLIHEKLVDGQLDECDLTFKDIRRIQAAFVRVLTAMLHRRIEYPDLPSVADLAVAAQVDGSLCSEPSEPALTGQAPAAGRAEGTGR